MMSKLTVAILICLSTQASAFAQRDSFKVRYLGGTVETKVSKEDWHNKLTILSDEIRLELKDGQKVSIDPRAVTSISYGRAATRHVARWVSLGILLGPIAAVGLFNENVQHYVSIEYQPPAELESQQNSKSELLSQEKTSESSDGKSESAEPNKAGVLIQAHKDNYRNVLALLRGATGQEIEVEKKNKKLKQP